MKKIIIFLMACCLAFIIGCESDIDKIYVSGVDASQLVTSDSVIVLSSSLSNSIVLALSWSESELYISDTSVSITNDYPGYVIEVSTSSDFSDIETIQPDSSNYYYFSGLELNTLATDLGFTAGVSTPMYFRINTSLSDNTNTYLSNVITIYVTSFSTNMSKGYILNSSKEETGFFLYSTNGDGEYYGFTGAGSWENWYLLEADGTIWGNYHDEDDVATEFLISSESSYYWNFWYPGVAGCYYTTLSTTDLEWTATLIPSLSISGDVSADMTFDRTSVTWQASITSTSDNATFKISTTEGALYNISTGTTDASAINKEFGFIPGADSSLSFLYSAASAGTITLGTAGDYTITLYLADPTNWHYSISSGTPVVVEPDSISVYLYLPGIDDGTSGSWTFDPYIDLVSNVDSTYAGVVSINSLWGYKMMLEPDQWDNYYGMGSSEGTLVYGSSTNITAPDSGLYYMQVDLANLTYSYTSIGDTLFIGGLNGNVWDFNMPLIQTSAKVFTGTVNYTTTSEWGIKLYFERDNWNDFFGGSLSALEYGGSAITDVQSLSTGTYNVTVDLSNMTCTFASK